MIGIMGRSSASANREFWLLQAGGWAAFVVALLIPWLGASPLGPMIVRKIPVACLGVLTTLGLRRLYQTVARARSPLWIVAAAVVAGSSAGGWIWVVVVERFASWFDPLLLQRGAIIRLSVERFPGAVYYMLVLGAWSVLYLGLSHARALVAERERALRAEAAADRARLQALRYQLNPHFLFNTLNAISTLVVEHRALDAERMIARLGEFLHLTVVGRSEDEIPLTDELEFVRRYLEIEAVRFADRLEVDIDADPATLGAQVPTLILQPLVENALRHAVERSEAPTRVTVAARRRDGMLELSVTDNGPGLVAGATKGHGVGLTNTQSRLRYHYGDAQRFALQRAEGGGTRAVIALPYAAAREAKA